MTTILKLSILFLLLIGIGCDSSYEQSATTIDPFISSFWNRRIRAIYTKVLPSQVDSSILDRDGNLEKVYFRGLLETQQLFGPNHKLLRRMQWRDGHSNYLISYDTIAGNVVQKWGKLKGFEWEQDTVIQDCEEKSIVYFLDDTGKVSHIVEYPNLTITTIKFNSDDNLEYTTMENSMRTSLTKKYSYRDGKLIRIEELLNGELQLIHYFSDLLDSTVFVKSEIDRYSVTYSYKFYGEVGNENH